VIPNNYSESDKKKGLIIIDELWFTPRIFSKYSSELCNEAKIIKKEAERRIKLFRSNDQLKSKAGNRIRVIGYSDNPDLEGLESITTVPGNTVNLVNNDLKDDFYFYIHAPFKDEDDENDRNTTSVVLQACFDVDGENRAGLAIFGGDSDCQIWEKILDSSDDESLEWDLLLAPHHCSWTFFSEESHDDNQTPSENSIDFLNKKREGANIISSSKPVEDDDDNLPHFAAAEEYKEIVGEDIFTLRWNILK